MISTLKKDSRFIFHKGLDWNAAGSKQVMMRIATPTLLLSMPLPDFTMPYNVITLTCTVIALFYGSVFNLFYRRYYPSSERQSLKDKFVKLLTFWIPKKSAQAQPNQDQVATTEARQEKSDNTPKEKEK